MYCPGWLCNKLPHLKLKINPILTTLVITDLIGDSVDQGWAMLLSNVSLHKIPVYHLIAGRLTSS